MKNFVLKAAKGTVFWLSAVFFLFLTVVSLIATTYFNRHEFYRELPLFRSDNILIHLIFLILILSALCFLNAKGILERIPLKILAVAAAIFVTALSILWVNVSFTYPDADQQSVSLIATQLTQGDFRHFEPEKYMQVYPNQLGIVAILEALYHITGGENQDAFRYLTAVANGAVVYLLYKVTDKLFHSKKADVLVLIGAAGCVQMVFYTTFLYGIMLGLAFALGAFYFLLVYLEKNKLGYAVLSGILIGISILVKNNYSIFLVAMIIVLLYKALEKKNLKAVLAALILIAATSILSQALTAFYEHRSGVPLGSGMPKTLWVAMGMQEGEREAGWYNEFNFNTFLETGCDIEESNEIAMESIRQSLQTFLEDPAYALDFYYRKTVSQWNEPTYAAFWVNKGHIGDYTQIVESIYDGKLYVILEEYMNLFQTLVFVSFLFCLISRRKKWTMEQLFIPLVLLGGFFFHIIWEAKSQYIFPYFVSMLPIAAMGLAKAVETVERIRQRRSLKKKAEEQ